MDKSFEQACINLSRAVEAHDAQLVRLYNEVKCYIARMDKDKNAILEVAGKQATLRIHRKYATVSDISGVARVESISDLKTRLGQFSGEGTIVEFINGGHLLP